jgi:hypothetical protein
MNQNTIIKVVVGGLALYAVYMLIKMRKPMVGTTSKGKGESNFVADEQHFLATAFND